MTTLGVQLPAAAPRSTAGLRSASGSRSASGPWSASDPRPAGSPPPAVPRSSLPRRPAEDLLVLGWRGLAEAAAARRPAERYASAHLAALRAAAALLAARARPAAPGSPRRRPASAWRLLAAVAPEFAEWAGFFAAGAAKRAAAEAGVSTAVTSREADDLLRDAESFLLAVGAAVGARATLPLTVGDRLPCDRARPDGVAP